MKLVINNNEIKNKLIMLIGMPRAGTTIYNTVFNSVENSFSISEPYWLFYSRGPEGKKQVHKFDKLGNIESKPENLFQNISNILLDNEEYDLGFIKETFSLDKLKSKSLNKSISDDFYHFFFIFRDPIMSCDSWLKTRWRYYNSYSNFIETANSFYDFYYEIQEKNKASVLSYEKLLSDKENYINEALKDFFTIEGKIEGSLRKQDFKLGDKGANNSIKLRQPRMKPQYLNSEQVSYIQNNFIKTYDDIMRNGNV